MSTPLSPELFQSLVDFEASNERVSARLRGLVDGPRLMHFFIDYASWNGCFANGVAALTSLIGAQRGLFIEAGFPRAVADRSNFIASFFFDAARDEYDDHISPLRDSHRCIAQATLISMAKGLGLDQGVLDQPESAELAAINQAVLEGYTGAPAHETVARVFWGMGYHLGSELLADREFSLIDAHLRAQHNDLVQHLMRDTVVLAGGKHRCYAWVGIHSGHGGGVEMDHFDHAIKGAAEALGYLAPPLHPQAIAALKAGFIAFEADHRRFFAMAA